MRSWVRASYGSAVELGLAEWKLATRPRTAYLLLNDGGCKGLCAFCPQSTGAHQDRVSRVIWPEYRLDSVLEAIAGSRSIERVCLQCSNEQRVLKDLPLLVRRFRESGSPPISVSLPPPEDSLIRELKGAGTDRLTVPIDCASARLFSIVKGGRMVDHLDSLRRAVALFGRERVGTHIIVGLGETEKDVVSLVAYAWEMGVMPSLFAFTPVRGTPMESKTPPTRSRYRRLQLAAHIIMKFRKKKEEFAFDKNGMIVEYPLSKPCLASIVKGGRAFETVGCPGCNRPYFNERVSATPFNFPYPPSEEEKLSIEEDLLESTPFDK